MIPSDAALLGLQAGVVAAPRRAGPRLTGALQCVSGRGWALIPAASVVGVIFLLRDATSSAGFLTWLALIAVPLLAAVALGWLMHGARWWLVPLAAGLFLLAWRTPDSLWGQGAGALLTALSCVTLGVLLAAVTPPVWLMLGIVAMAGVDTWLVASDLLQSPNDVLVAAAPGHGLPQLQSETFGSMNLGYGDLFVAALLGSVWARRFDSQRTAAAVTLVIAALFDLLFFAVPELPATVPVALALVVLELSALRGRSRPAVETPPPG